MVYGLMSRLFVESCPACEGPSDGGFCRICAAAFARVASPCARCGLAKPVRQCPLVSGGWHVDAVLAPFAYRPPLDHYVRALKYHGVRTLGRALALLLVPALALLRGDIDTLVAVPLHGTRRRERGYNQALEIALTLARELRLPELGRGVARRTAAATQTEQGAEERRASVAHAFHVAGNFAGRRIGIVDDVVTTGATVNALAAQLRAAGAARCVVIAVARTPLGSPRRGTAEPGQGRNV
jgi:ComF family protein